VTGVPRPPQVSTAQITGLLAWARELLHQQPADPAERAAFTKAKNELLNRLTDNDDQVNAGGEA
jgi:hypothetical protein